MKPIVSVVICTRDRSEDLAAAIDSITGQEVGKEFFELLVVDNASTDHTRALVRARARQISNIKYICEANVGLSYAPNTGFAFELAYR